MAAASDAVVREKGRCAMRGACGRKGTFGVELPCPDNRNATKSDDVVFLSMLHDLCGDDFGDTTCCTTGQLENLAASLTQAEPLIATCPACRSNFRHFYCSFTCSPDQSLFLSVTETQELKDGDDTKTAVKTVEFNVDPRFGSGFYDSCKDVKFGATNGLAMDLIGGGAKNWLAFLRYMGQERPLGSPFQINYPEPDKASSDAYPLENELKSNATLVPFHDQPRLCSDPDLKSRCACLDCPDVCSVLPPAPRPAYPQRDTCHVGAVTCFSFTLLMLYAVIVIASAIYLITDAIVLKSMRKGDSLPLAWKRFKHTLSRSFTSDSPARNGYDRVPMADPAEYDESPASLRSAPPRDNRSSAANSLVGAGSTAHALDGEESSNRRPNSGSSNTHSSSPHTLRSQHRLAPTETSDISSNPFLQPRTYALNDYLSSFFYRLGLFCARRPFLTLAAGLAVCGILNLGWSRFEVERDPVNLWVAKGSASERAKTEFDQAFGPFYRTEQVFVSVAPPVRAVSEEDDPSEGVSWTPIDEAVLSWDRLQWWADVEERIRALRTDDGIGLEDVCLSPQTDPEPADDPLFCVVQSFMGYLGNDVTSVDEDSWAETLNECASSPALCLPPSGQPLNPKLLFGQIPPTDDDRVLADQSRAFALTLVVKNSLNDTIKERAAKWESVLKTFLLDLARPDGEARAHGVQLAFSTEISLEEELNAAANTDVGIVVFSYLLMFFYVSINLGSSGAGLLRSFGRLLLLLGHGSVHLFQLIPIFSRRDSSNRPRSSSVTMSLSGSTSGMGAYFKRQVLVDSKFLLGMWGIVIVLLSVSTSVALFSLLGVKVTLIIAEVIPFLVLAIGVDNVFILCHEVDEQNARAYASVSRGGGFFGHEEEQEDDMIDALPSAEERVARALGRMGPSILLSAASETVAFALGAMVGMPAVRNFAIYAAGAVAINALLQVTVFVSAIALDLKRIESNRIDCFPCLKLNSVATLDLGSTVSEGLVARFIRTVYAPILLKRAVKFLVLAIFGIIFVLSWISSRHIVLGLDQRLALPSSSYLVPYFNAVDAYLGIGPPVYFVSDGIAVTERANQQKLCGRFTTCNEFSLANVLEAERKRPEVSFLAEPPAVWLDDFFQWLNPVLEDCCRISKKDPDVFCSPEDPDFACKPCFEDREPPWNITMEGLPQGDEFNRFVAQWLKSPTDETCPLGGKAGYSNALHLDKHSKSVIKSQFRTFSTPLKTQDDFINALAASQRIANDLTRRTGSKVFPYSLFHVFFDQYTYIVATTREVLTLAIAAVLVVTSLLLGSWRTGFVVTGTVFLTVFNVMGMMGAWGISLNAISLVNLVISVGIAVEFCSHIARAFMGASSGGLSFEHPAGHHDRDERARLALVDVGSSVFSGITVTKLIGISVLALTRSKLLEMYYFRMWLSLIVSGALHGLVFLPVALSFQGGQGFALTSDEEGWLPSSIGHRYDFENRPFLHGEDDSSEEGHEYQL